MHVIRIKAPNSGAATAGATIEASEVKRRLDLVASPELLDDIHIHLLAVREAEDERFRILETKATSLLTVTGLSATLAFTFGASVLIKDGGAAFVGVSEGIYRAISGFYILALTVGGAAGLYAMRALRIREYDGLDVVTILPLQLAEFTGEADGATQKLRYRRWILSKVCDAIADNSTIIDTKVVRVQRGQLCFNIFLAALLVLGIALGLVACGRGIQTNKDSVATNGTSHSSIATSQTGSPVAGAQSVPIVTSPTISPTVPSVSEGGTAPLTDSGATP